MDAWDTALRARDRDKMIEVLKIAEWSDAEAAETTDFILADPTKYEV